MRYRDRQRNSENERSDRRREYRELERRTDSSCRKRPRHEEARTYARPGNSDRRDGEPSPKRVQHNRSSPRDRVKSDGRYDKSHHRTSTYPYASRDRQRKDTPDNELCSQFGLECSKRSQTVGEKYGGHLHARDRHKQSHMNNDKTSSELNFTHEQEREKDHRDRSPRLTRQKLQLPVDGATSSQKRHEVVPYASSEASSSSREHHSAMKKNDSLMKVLSMVDCGFIPSLPEKYYSIENVQVKNQHNIIWTTFFSLVLEGNSLMLCGFFGVLIIIFTVQQLGIS